jgi:hypothetical protein
MCKSGGTFSISTWYYEAWNTDVKSAINALDTSLPWPETSDELIMAWATGPWQIPAYCKSMLAARGFIDVKVELKSVHMPMDNADDFADIYEAFIEMVTDKYWTEAQRQNYRPLVRNAVTTHLNARYGEGKAFTTERVAVMAVGRKP